MRTVTDFIAVPDWADPGATRLKLNLPQSSIIDGLSLTNGSFAPRAVVPSETAFDPGPDFGAIEATRSSVLNAAVANNLFMIRGTEL